MNMKRTSIIATEILVELGKLSEKCGNHEELQLLDYLISLAEAEAKDRMKD